MTGTGFERPQEQRARAVLRWWRRRVRYVCGGSPRRPCKGCDSRELCRTRPEWCNKNGRPEGRPCAARGGDLSRFPQRRNLHKPDRTLSGALHTGETRDSLPTLHIKEPDTDHLDTVRANSGGGVQFDGAVFVSHLKPPMQGNRDASHPTPLAGEVKC